MSDSTEASERAPGLSLVELSTTDSVELDRAQLTDQQRLAVVLQSAAVLSHLEHGGWFLPSGWQDLSLTADGLVRLKSVRRGHSDRLVQVQLAQLLRRLFRTEDTVAGRGEARRSARYLLQRWQQVLAPTTADQAVSEVFEAAPFLWRPAFAAARRLLAAEHRVDGDSHLWLAGPGAARRRFFSRAAGLGPLQDLLVGEAARDLWEGWRHDLNPAELTAKGQWLQAVVAWRRDPPRHRDEVLAYARGLFALGRYAQTLEVLKRQRNVAARLLRAQAQLLLGEQNAARATVKQLEQANLSADQLIDLAEVAIRLAAYRGRLDDIRRWVARCLDETRGKARLKACLVAVGAAYDCDDPAAMDRYLEASREALEHADLAGSWHHARGLRSIKAKDGPGAEEHVGTALQLDRRRLLRIRAARLWNDLAVCRTLADDLPGAERALLHAQRLSQDVDGPTRTSLTLFNLAEVRLRRGRTKGVASTLERAMSFNRRSGNLRGLMQDLELWVRLELTQGRAAAALVSCREALEQIDCDGLSERRGVFEVLAARAHGWLQQPERAARCLERAEAESVHELELEERPAIWALAGQPGKALAEAAETRWASLWQALIAGQHPSPRVWESLSALEPYRAARLIFDCELVSPGVVPPGHVRRATATLRKCGATPLAEQLESCSLSSWRALRSYLARAAPELSAVKDLFAQAGYSDAHLIYQRHGKEKVLLAGVGGEQELSAVAADGKIILRTPFIDSVLEAFFGLICRDLAPLLAGSASTRRATRSEGIVGESPVLRQALKRLDRLAGDDLSILILGESGTGKELMAQRAHRLSRRAEGPFVPVNCAELSESLTQSDLFGHVKGAFTGADRNRPGIFETASSGTVFLDEIGDLPASAQGKLLRVLQEGEMRRVGESLARKINVRILAATHRDLAEMVQQGTFRQDLYFRLKVATVTLAPLRDRGHDVLLLADHFLARHHRVCRLTEGARKKLAGYAWPGNVRELQNVLRVAAALAPDNSIHSQHLDLPQVESSRGNYHQIVDRQRRRLISEAMSASGGNRAAAARRLGLTRQALSYLVKQLELD